MHVSARMKGVQTPVIPVIGEMIRATAGAISLGQGVVYYGPPREAVDRAARYATEGDHTYKPVQGIAELLSAIRDKHVNEDGFDSQAEGRSVVVTAGGNMGFMNAVLAIADPEDEIILPTPYYFNHEMAVVIAGCRPVLVATDERFQLRPEALAAAITPKTRAIVTISPNNPSGAVYSPQSLARVNAICREAGVYHIADEAYEYFVYDGARRFATASLPQSAGHTISLYSLSKAYGFAAWRIGWMVLPEHLLTAVKKIQDTILICPPVVSQLAAVGALSAGRDYCERHLQETRAVREIVLNELESISGIATVPRAQGAFYFLAKLHTRLASMTVVERLIREYGVGVLPGDTFGIGECAIRIAYGALSQATAREGVARLVRGLKGIVQ